MKKKIFLDIGGGNGRHFLKQALENPDKEYIILDVAISGRNDFQITQTKWQIPKDSPPNLHFIAGGIFEKEFLPFRQGKIDVIEINFLFGEIFPYVNLEKTQYSRLLKEVKRLLNEKGEVFISDVKRNIFLIEDLLIKQGFLIQQEEPKEIGERKRTFFTEFFFEIIEEAKRIGKGTGVATPYYLQVTSH